MQNSNVVQSDPPPPKGPSSNSSKRNNKKKKMLPHQKSIPFVGAETGMNGHVFQVMSESPSRDQYRRTVEELYLHQE